MQSLRGIRDIHESGVDERSFSEVTRHFADCTDVCHRLLAWIRRKLSIDGLRLLLNHVDKTLDNSTADNVF